MSMTWRSTSIRPYVRVAVTGAHMKKGAMYLQAESFTLLAGPDCVRIVYQYTLAASSSLA